MRAVALREDIKDLILDAAERLLDRYGFRKMTMDDLAQEVGIAKATIYQHFSNKEDVALGRIDRAMGDLLKKLSEIAIGPGDTAARLESLLVIRIVFRAKRARVGAYDLDEQLASIRPTLRSRQGDYFRQEAALVEHLLIIGIEEGRYAGVENPGRTARSLIAATNGLLPSNLSHSYISKISDIESHARDIAHMLVRGLSV